MQYREFSSKHGMYAGETPRQLPVNQNQPNVDIEGKQIAEL
jgi:hypothetical protein